MERKYYGFRTKKQSRYCVLKSCTNCTIACQLLGVGKRRMKKKTPEKELELLRENLLHERAIWKRINENGCNDPFWADGCNMNLTRNHILSYRDEIANCCEKHNLPLPEEYFLKVPPEVDNDYMANFNQKDRVDRLKQQGDTLSHKKKKFIDDGQMEFC